MSDIAKSVLDIKLDNLARCIVRIEAQKPISVQELSSDFDRQDIIALNLERAVQSCVDMAVILVSRSDRPPSSTMAGAFQILESEQLVTPVLADAMKKAVGLRNILVHSYTAVDWQIVWSVIDKKLDEFKEFGRVVSSLV